MTTSTWRLSWYVYRGMMRVPTTPKTTQEAPVLACDSEEVDANSARSTMVPTLAFKEPSTSFSLLRISIPTYRTPISGVSALSAPSNAWAAPTFHGDKDALMEDLSTHLFLKVAFPTRHKAVLTSEMSSTGWVSMTKKSLPYPAPTLLACATETEVASSGPGP